MPWCALRRTELPIGVVEPVAQSIRARSRRHTLRTMLTAMVAKMIATKTTGTESTASHPSTGSVSATTRTAAAVNTTTRKAATVRWFTSSTVSGGCSSRLR